MTHRLDWLGVKYYSRAVATGKRNLLARLFLGIPVVPGLVEGYGLLCKPRNKSIDGLPTSDSGWEVYPQGIV